MAYLFARKGNPSSTGVPQGATAVPNTGGLMRSLADNGTGMIPEPSDPASAGAQGMRWWAGPPQNIMYIVGVQGKMADADNSNNQPLPPLVIAPPFPDSPLGGVTFWGRPSALLTDSTLYVQIGNWAYRVKTGNPGTFNTPADVTNWLQTVGFWSNYTGTDAPS